MCRILAMSSDLKPYQQKALEEFQKLSVCGKVPASIPAGHKDGWGLAAYGEDKTGIVFYVRRPYESSYDPVYRNSADIIREMVLPVIIGHLRKALVGNNTTANTHPFVIGNFAFCHNGSVSFTSDDLLESDYKKLVNGQTDSEKLFCFLMQLIFKNNDDVSAAIVELLKFIRGKYDYTALNFILTDGKTIWALREVNEDNEWVKKLNMRDSYYTLYRGSDDSGKVNLICSEPLPVFDLKWNLIPNHALVSTRADAVATLII